MQSRAWQALLVSGAGYASCVLVILAAGTIRGQTVLEGSGVFGSVNILNTDAAILEAQEPRKDLPCNATPVKPVLGFDLKFHSGYEVSIPLKELAGIQNVLNMIIRVRPADSSIDPVYMSQRVKVPEIEENAHGDATLEGTFDVGEGKYHVDWLMRDRMERVCSAFWDIDATLPAKDKSLSLDIPPNAVVAADLEPFKDEAPVEPRAASPPGPPLSVKVIVNFAPQDSNSATLQPLDTHALIWILRSMSREPRIGKFSIIAFNVQEQRIVYRQENSSRVDFPALGEALRSLNLGTVNVKKLGQKRGESDFLANLFTQELSPRDNTDAVIFAGPKVMLDSSVPQESLKRVADADYPVFYMNYTVNPQAVPWRDAIGNAVKYLKGTEYTIARPRDLWNAWGDIMSRIVKLKLAKHAGIRDSH